MKLITLNTWGGKIKEPFISFLKAHQDADIFCFQEIFHDAAEKTRGDFGDAHFDLYNEMKSLLPEMTGYFCPTVEDYYGIATFVRKGLTVQASGDITIYENPEYEGGANHSRKALWVELDWGGKTLSILNVHGLWNGKGKTDTPERIEQSKRIRNFMDSVKGGQIICGDFNLLPETESLSILEEGMQNLVKEFNVTSTRTSLYARAETSGKFADYIFVSPDIKVVEFKVLPDEVSDHSPLHLEIE